MKVTKILLVAALAFSFGYGIDLSKKKDDDLVKLQGTLKGEDAVDLALEVRKRVAKMSEKNKPKYMEKVKAAFEKATDSWNAKELRAYKKALKEGVKARVEKMSDADKKAYGFDEASGCPMHAGEHKH
ncbi:DUF1104 domain-containing protein [Helicobacter mastomyrinus]|uniref:DUF1104 domain-containing protein n=1 Tax=Helicobacter mastomyrinus TaxID=287948 RepID=A0ABZ3F541_9HELI